jgi:hypothetical protein
MFFYNNGNFIGKVGVKGKDLKLVEFMIVRHQIVKKSISVAIIIALLDVHFSFGMTVLCSMNTNKTMSCCKKVPASSNNCNSDNSNTLSFKTPHSCPCPSMQSGQNKSFDEVLPATGKIDSKPLSIEWTSASSELFTGSISTFLTNSRVYPYLSPQDRLSLIQTFLI